MDDKELNKEQVVNEEMSGGLKEGYSVKAECRNAATVIVCLTCTNP
jgi:hypothetical protein